MGYGPRMRPSRAAASAAVLGAVLLAAGGCGGGDSTTTPSTSSSATTTGSTVDQITETSAPGEASSASGGDSTQPAESDPQQVSDAIDAVLASPDSATVCAKVITPTALKNFYGSRSACLNGRPKPTLADSVQISGLKIDGDAASAKAKPKGGLYDGETVTVTAVRGADGWQIAGLKANVPVGP